MLSCAPKTPQQEAEEQKLRDAEELAKRESSAAAMGEDRPVLVSSKIGQAPGARDRQRRGQKSR
jgi:hypothetical protein